MISGNPTGMNPAMVTKRRLSLMDTAFNLMDSVRSPQDFTLIFHFRDPPNLESVRAGAGSARNRYPISASHIGKQMWACRSNEAEGPEIVSVGADQDCTDSIQRFVNEPFDLRVQTPVKQMVISNGSRGARLVTRFHHAAADGLSAAMWLGHQLSVAYGLARPEAARAPFTDLPLRTSPMSVRRSRFAYRGACDRLWTSNSDRSGTRHWVTKGFPASDLRQASRRAGGFTYSDLLATCVLEVFRDWNRKNTGNGSPKIGLWLPMNIRRHSSLGFGNGTSRIRLYARYRADASLIEKCREVRRQISWNSKHGEWVVPEILLFTRLPGWMIAPFLRGYLDHPSVDMATGIFSHADRWVGDAGEAFKHVERIECVGLLHPRQNLAINAATHCDQTWLTFTYDPGVLEADQVRELAQMYERQIALARQALL